MSCKSSPSIRHPIIGSYNSPGSDSLWYQLEHNLSWLLQDSDTNFGMFVTDTIILCNDYPNDKDSPDSSKIDIRKAYDSLPRPRV